MKKKLEYGSEKQTLAAFYCQISAKFWKSSDAFVNAFRHLLYKKRIMLKYIFLFHLSIAISIKIENCGITRSCFTFPANCSLASAPVQAVSQSFKISLNYSASSLPLTSKLDMYNTYG